MTITLNPPHEAIAHLLVGCRQHLRPTRKPEFVQRQLPADRLTLSESVFLRLAAKYHPPQSWYDDDDNPFEAEGDGR